MINNRKITEDRGKEAYREIWRDAFKTTQEENLTYDRDKEEK